MPDLRNPKIVTLITINVCLLMAIGVFVWSGWKTLPPLPLDRPIPVQPQPPSDLTPSPKHLDQAGAKATITEEDCNKILTWLADDEREGRMSGKRGNVESANHIAEEFKRFGLEVKMQQFKIRRMNPGPKNEEGDDFTNNIIGILPGKSSRQIIIGGHMDHIGYGPSMSRSNAKNEIHNGADDNASGSTLVLELAEAFSKMEQPNHTLVFVCFSAEEMGLIGSRFYVSELSQEEKKNIDLMVNFDMVGWLKGQKSITISGIKQIPEVVSIMEKLNGSSYSFDAQAGGAGGGGSDHAPFGNANIPYAFFHTGLHDHYHKPSDDTDKIDFGGLVEIGQYAFEMIHEFDKAQLVRTAPVSYPVLNEMVHDHGHPEVKFPNHKDYKNGNPHPHSHD